MNALLAQRLQDEKILGADEFLIANEEQRASGDSFEQCLLRLGLLSEMDLAVCVAAIYGLETIDLERTIPTAPALAMLSGEVARRHMVLPVLHNDGEATLELAIADPGNLVALDEVSALLKDRIRIVMRVAGRERLLQAIDLYYGGQENLSVWVKKLAVGTAADAVVVGFMDALFADAMRHRASDLHLEPERGFVRIRYRIDGVLRLVLCVHKRHWASLVVRLKIMAGLDIAEQRRPQDGRISVAIVGRDVDVRVSTLPTVYGENIVMRLLDSQRGIVSFKRMGLSQKNISALEKLLLRPEGVVFVTGPTGSGKTTTLYTIIDKLNKAEVNIMTLEDPVEYQLPMVRQCAIGGGVQFGFADGTRTLLRQDPDIILIGEVRDEQTAQMTLRAAMSGHLVLATLHCGSALGAVPRLVDMGVSPVMLDSCVNGVIAQRLVRKLCNCRVPWQPEVDDAALFGDDVPVLYKAKGCVQCSYNGYIGRITLVELWQPLVGQCEALANGSLAPHRASSDASFHGLAECGLEVVRHGLSTLQELRRVVYVDGCKH
ncbi:MAG: GspE/PulE family protein [Candidatus Porifericomitaceae bacterium WSBS_2022_MAG_OTU9]